jgi:NitT/TauT family transport system substrate-binding protein
MSTSEKPTVRIAPNNPVFDLPAIVAIQEGVFDRVGLDVQFTATYADRETDDIERPVMSAP